MNAHRDPPQARAPVLIMAGGTGGHVFPALAVAEALRARDVPVVWMGTRRGLEAHLVPAAGIPIEWLSIVGLRGRGLVTLLLFGPRLLRALLQAWRILGRWQPCLALGMGGFAAGPGGIAAWLRRIPLVIHEQNAVPGLTNRILARFARHTLEAVPGSFAPRPAEHTGNPVRAAIGGLPPPCERLAGREGPLRLLVLGGSRGAAALNALLPQACARLPAGALDVWHQSGAHGEPSAIAAAYGDGRLAARVDGFIDDMAAAYAWADLVVCRAGAMTIAELAAAGVAAILVPFPHAVDDHQTRNARYLHDAGAAWLLAQDGLDAGELAACIERLRSDRERLLRMARSARALAVPDAAGRVARVCLELAR